MKQTEGSGDQGMLEIEFVKGSAVIVLAGLGLTMRMRW